MRDELQTARDMQMGLLPEHGPELDGYSLHGVCIPANTVGGDYFAYRWLDPEERLLAIVVADVSGKAMEAAVTGLRFNEMLRYECRGRTDPGEILDGLNASLEGQIDEATFVTCCIGVLDVTTGDVAIASAGHCMPLHYAASAGAAASVAVTGFPLGLSPVVRPDEAYTLSRVTLAAGDVLLLYTDGVVEAQNGQGLFYEDPRLLRLLKATAGEGDAARVVRAVVRDVERFIGNAPRTDDVTAVALKREA
jgi:sigma-B regulation protein RsbU (phosphoserine phosphatase)